MLSALETVKRLRDRWILPKSGRVSVRDLSLRFQPVPLGSLTSLLMKMSTLADAAAPAGGSLRPYYHRSKPVFFANANPIPSELLYIDLTNVHLPPYGDLNSVAEAVDRFDLRGAEAVKTAVASISTANPPHDSYEALLESKPVPNVGIVAIVKAESLAAMAYPDYFPSMYVLNFYRLIVSQAILAAGPGLCGTGGDYDMSQMHLLQIAYRYYDELGPDASEHLIRHLLAEGIIAGYDLKDIPSSGRTPKDWNLHREAAVEPWGGVGLGVSVPETENHILTIHTTRYLTNQLLYQRDRNPDYDNRRNGGAGVRSCMDLMLYLLRNFLMDDFSEYNAKNYQTQSRYALLNLCSYAYDHEVRLAARMVLDYVSAHIAVSSNDLRRMVPFRRRNEGKNATRTELGFMDIGLLETTFGADPMAQHFAILAGNTRIYGRATPNHPEWKIFTGGTDGNDAVMYALSDYRLPPSIHDLFVNDMHRRFFQKLHRRPGNEVSNCDNFEIYAGSPSYLITAGGAPAGDAIDQTVAGHTFGPDPRTQQGVAVTTSFMPTTRLKPDVIPLLNTGDPSSAIDLIQFGSFSELLFDHNYGVAPDFACGHQVHLPLWCKTAIAQNRDIDTYTVLGTPYVLYDKFEFVDRGSAGNGPGFFLAFLRDGDLAVMEAFDTWLHPDLTFETFKRNVYTLNRDLMNRGLHSGIADEYRTQNGNIVHFVIWDGSEDTLIGRSAYVRNIDYSGNDPTDIIENAGTDILSVDGNISEKFLSGTVLNSSRQDEAIIEIANPFLGTKIILDMSDPAHPKRTAETGEVEEAGSNHEVWVDFGWKGLSEGDFFRPFSTITAAASAVAYGGVIKIMPGWTTEKRSFPSNKQVRLVAPIGGVTLGVR